MPRKPYLELRYASPNKVLVGATLVSGDLRVELPALREVRARAIANGPDEVELTLFGMHTKEVWDDAGSA